ncbi:MAG: DEAD/DEAH box helicase [Spirochaetaceae bacterium]|nr:DEAD/DEAH box helicase [Spirochaetaceae bacterium]
MFCNTKRYTEIIARRLGRNGVKCEFISGDLPQQKRLAIIEDLKNGKNNILVATDVAARGLDIEGLSLVVNYDLPVDAENYVHRIGRTARAGKTGKAISMASEQDVYELADIEKYIAAKIPSEVADESLLADDKSGGAYSDDRRERHERRERDGGRRPERERGGRDGRSGRDGERRSGGRSGRGERFARPERSGQSAQTGRDGAEGEKQARQKHGDSRQSGRRDERAANQRRPRREVGLSQMTLDERMAYYNEKYGDAPPSKEAAQGAAQGADKPGTDAKGAGNGRRRDRNRKRQAERQGENRGKKSGTGSTISGRNVSKKPDSVAGPKPPEPAKKGLFSKLAALFKGKKG